MIGRARCEVRRRSKVACVRDVLAKAERATSKHNIEKLTVTAKGGLCRFAARPLLLHHVPENVAKSEVSALGPYRETLPAERWQVLDAYHPVLKWLEPGVSERATTCFFAPAMVQKPSVPI